jgi:hypothetical protein
VTVFLNHQGVLSVAGTYSVDGDPYSITATDLNGDGFVDLVTGNYSQRDSAGSVSVLISRGDGTFYPAVSYSSYIVNAGGLKSGRFGTSQAPSVIADSLLALEFYEGIGDGGLQAPIPLETGGEGELALADFNSDGVLDVAEANFSRGFVTVYLGAADGGLMASGFYAAVVPIPSVLFDIQAGDLNSDGIPDLAVATAPRGVGLSGTVGILLGLGDGGFGVWNAIPAPGNVYRLAVADLDGDGTNEVLLTASDGGALSLLQLTLGDAGSMLPILSCDGGVASLLVGDFDRDGAQDIAALGDNGVTIYLNGCP